MALIVLDANILLYAWNESDPHHEPARQWVEALLSGPDDIGIPWVTQWAFVRLTTNPRVFPRPLSANRALDIVTEWASLPQVVAVQPGPRHLEILRGLIVDAKATGPLVTDAVLAAIALEHGAILASTDHDFSRFPGLSWVNPLA